VSASPERGKAFHLAGRHYTGNKPCIRVAQTLTEQWYYQAAKVSALQAAYRRREAETPRDQAPSAGEIRSLGLLDRSKDAEVDIKHGTLLPTYGSNVPK